MIAKKPSIYIYVNHPNPSVLHEICAGIEEEGVFYEITEMTSQELDHLVWTAAEDSVLGTGIGIRDNSAGFSIRGLKEGKMVAYYAYPTKEESRLLGSNSARAIKKQSFKDVL